MLVAAEQLDVTRCLLGFPHPSGGNGHRVRQFHENQARLRKEIEDWADAYTRRQQPGGARHTTRRSRP